VPRSTYRLFFYFSSRGLISVKRDFNKALLASPNREVNVLARVARVRTAVIIGASLRDPKTLFSHFFKSQSSSN